MAHLGSHNISSRAASSGPVIAQVLADVGSVIGSLGRDALLYAPDLLGARCLHKEYSMGYLHPLSTPWRLELWALY